MSEDKNDIKNLEDIIKLADESGSRTDKMQVFESLVSKLYPDDEDTLKMMTNVNPRKKSLFLRMMLINDIYFPHLDYRKNFIKNAMLLEISSGRGGRNDLRDILKGFFSKRDEEESRFKALKDFVGEI